MEELHSCYEQFVEDEKFDSSEYFFGGDGDVCSTD